MNDLISRQMVIDKINERQRKLIYCFCFDNDMVKIIDIVKSIVIAIPPAQPEQKVGRWILHPEWEIDGECSTTCSECEMGVDVLYNFCPRCGAKMERRTDG